MKIIGPIIVALITALLLCGCVRETTTQELDDLVTRYQMNTVATAVYYAGSDDDFDYFYLDVPLGKNEAVKVQRGKPDLSRRFPATRDKEKWELYHPFIQQIPAHSQVVAVPETADEK